MKISVEMFFGITYNCSILKENYLHGFFSVLCCYCLLVISREVFFVSKGHRKPETYRANLCDQHKFCASRSVLLGME